MDASLSTGSLRSKTSPSSPLVAQRLTPRRLPPIVFEGRRITDRSPPPPPSSPAPWSRYHRNCALSPKPQKRLHRRHKPSKSPKLPNNAVQRLLSKPQLPNKQDLEVGVPDPGLESSPASSITTDDLSPFTQSTSEGSSSPTSSNSDNIFAKCTQYKSLKAREEEIEQAFRIKEETETQKENSPTRHRAEARRYYTVAVDQDGNVRISRQQLPLITLHFTGRAVNPPRMREIHPLKMFKVNDEYLAIVPVKLDRNMVIKIWSKKTYTPEEVVLLRSLPKLAGISLEYQGMYQSLLQESKMSAFLLQVAQAIFEEMVSLDLLIKKILEVAQRLVSADRASLFLVDHRNFELVSTVFDLRYEPKQESDFSKKEIRMPINKGIAGHVAMSGETMNIPDAYSDERFNKAVDEATGYRTISILCMPIKVRGKVIAVVQMVNKRDKEAFGMDDEVAFQVFSTFFGLALHHARLYDKIKRKEQKYKVALDVLGYHNTCAEEEVENLLEERKKKEKINYNDFALNPFEVNEMEKCKGILTMFDDLFDITNFDVAVLARFVMTVKKNYRKVPYHNFDHGWSVANSIYVILKHDTENRFDYNNRLALFVACLCHDLDHRGYTNKFMSEIASPLAAVYTTSTLEHHHFNMTVTILQQDGHNIFYHMSSEGYKEMLDSIRQCILATDLAAFFPNLKKINELVFETTQFDWNDASHSTLSRNFAMTCADLCAAAKPFPVQLETVDIITEEFYQQGDLERQVGRTPISMMDRSRPEELPASQVEFLSQVCLPCYKTLHELFPRTKPMLMMANDNLASWKARTSAAEENKD